MADNQKVQVDFQFDLGNVPESAKAFTKYLETIGVNLKFTKGSTDALASSLDHLAVSQTKATAAGEAASSSLKNTNKQWTSLALVIQDLPYGFRGIQNNLPALVGGFAGMTGGLYFAASAVIAFFTAWDNGMISFGNSSKLAKEYTKSLAEGFAAETVNLESLYRVATNVNGAMEGRISAAKTLKEIYPGLLGLYSEEDILIGNAKTAYEELTTTLWQYAQAKAAEKTLEDIAKKRNELAIEKTKLLQVQAYRQLKAYQKTKALTLDQMTFMQRLESFVMSMGGDQLLLNDVAALTQVSEALFENEKATKAVNAEALDYKIILDDSIDAANKLAIAQGKDPKSKEAVAAAKKAAAEKVAAEKAAANKAKALRDKELEELKTANITAGLELLDAQSKEEQIVINKYTKLLNLAAKYKQDTTVLENGKEKELSNIRKKYDDIEYKRNQDSINANIAFESKIYNDSNKAVEEQQKLITETQVNFSKQRIAQVKSEADQSIKANRLNYQAQKTALEEAIAKLAIFQAFSRQGAAATLEFANAINVLKGQLAGLVDPMENLKNQLNIIIGDTLKKLTSSLGENIGKMLSQGGGISDVINSFLGILADGLIQVGQLAIATGFAIEGIKKALESLNPVVAIAAGIALVALGTYVKGRLSESSKSMSGGGAKAFANGGIISGPTMGLMGEYPGARTNPEVVAPLDKLKDMIGGNGGGSFVLRGTDLVLALNRSETSLNLRRGS